ncbi:cell division cycle and apoptosis regulator protein 1-like isoform X2 [Stegostoma tigrinum]|uniref:cell division cycle and apoptosis regulator protein 1-like isoform X2 n=1 Tax=Stegostoma tigrinum TaxID=3053191 RepID=UPI00202B8EA5|nr:cell division cycle and apoptosis regulator protein 1-like isoform X2 [Stegostoma tigrinum]
MWGNQFQSATKAGVHGGQQQSLLGPGPPSLQQALLQGHGQAGQSQKQRVFTGVVTSLHDYFGFIDEEVLFHLNVVKGRMPQAGERVLVKAVYNPSHSVKWNALKVQVQPTQSPSPMMSGQKQGILGAKPQPQPLLQAPRIPSLLSSQPLLSQLSHKPGLLQPLVHLGPHAQLGRRLDLGLRSMGRNGRMDIGRRGDRRDNYKRLGGQGSSQKRYQDMGSGEGPAKKARHYIPSYSVQYSRFSLDCSSCDTIEVQRRYPCLHIPNMFFDSKLCWVNTFPLNEPLQLGQKCVFHVMEEGSSLDEEQETQVEPDDADSTYSAKVILLSCPDLQKLYSQACTLAEAPKETADVPQHPNKLIKFLVGMKGKEEAVLIGGPWSPSLDGLSPEKDPRVLIKTAIRTTKSMTGIDLSACTQWFRFAEIRYHQPGELREGRLLPARVETVVVFLPDVWHCLPTRLEWDALSLGYTQQLTDRDQAEHKDTDRDEPEEKMEEQGEDSLPTPTQWSSLDLKTMKVEDFRRELKARNLSFKGTKAQLVSRLEKELEEEAAKEEIEKDETAEQKEAAMEATEEESSPAEEQKEDVEGKQPEDSAVSSKQEPRCPLPAEPSVIVRPNCSAMGGNFGCAVLSLSTLRSYRSDSKGYSFEVLWLAELFGEMLQRDFGYTIYKAVLAFPERKPEEVVEKPKAASANQEKGEKDQKEMEQEEKSDELKKEAEEMKEAEELMEAEETKETSEAPAKATAMEEDENWDWELTKPDEGETKEKDVKGKDADDDALLQIDDVLFLEENEEDFGLSNTDEKKPVAKSNEAESGSVKEMEKDISQMVSLRKDVLLAFVYFDRNLCNYILEKDLEQIISTLGLHLSRAQIKQLLSKVCSQNMCLYRTLTDGWEGDLEKLENKSLITEDMLLGNHHLLPSCPGVSPSKPRTRSGDTTLTEHNGNMVNVGNLIQKLERDERNRAEMENKLQSMESQLAETLGKLSSNDSVNKSLSSGMQEMQKQVSELEDRVKAAEKLKAFYELRLQDNTRNLNSMIEDIQRIIKKNNAVTEKKEK